MSQNFPIFWYGLVWDMYIMWQKQLKILNVPAVVDCIVLVGVLTHCTLLHSMCDLNAVQKNVQYSLIQEFMLTSSNWAITPWKQSKTFVVQKGEGRVDYSNQMNQEISLGLQKTWHSGKVR